MRRLIGIFCIVSLLWAPSAFAGSQFYLTIERSFAPTEPIALRLDFLDSKTPITLRVLRPDNVESFLVGQLNLSRSYEEPLAKINPSHYLLRGLNEVRSPISRVRFGLSDTFRNAFGGDEFNNAVRRSSNVPLVGVPEEISQSIPQGFRLEREVYVDLQKGGELPEGLYDGAWWGGDRYQVRSIALDPLPDGIYLVQGVQGKLEGQAILQVSSLGVQVKQSSETLVVRTVDRGGAPVAGAQVAVRDGRGGWQTLPGSTDSGGGFVFHSSDRLDGKLLVRVSSGDSQALVDTDFLPSRPTRNDALLITDRPIFKPGDTFQFKGILKERVKGALGAPASGAGRAVVSVLGQDGEPASEPKGLAVTSFGTFSGEVALDPDQKPGLYRVVAEVGEAPYAGELRVRDYVKPTYYLSLLSRDPTVRPGESFRFKFQAKRYSGGVPKGAKYEVYLYRKKFSSPEWVEDAGGSLVTGTDYFGGATAAGALSQPQRLFSSVEVRQTKGEGFDIESPWSSASVIPDDGMIDVEIPVPSVPSRDLDEDWVYSLVVRALAPDGASAVLSEEIAATSADAVPMIRFDRAFADSTAKELLLRVRALYPDGKGAPRAEGSAIVNFEDPDGRASELTRVNFTTDGNGDAQISLPSPNRSGRVTAKSTLVGAAGKPFARAASSREAFMFVRGEGSGVLMKDQPLQLVVDSTVLEPGGTTRMLALLPSSWGKGTSGTVWETTAGERVHEVTSRQINGATAWLDVQAKPEYGTGFFKTLTVPLKGGRFVEQTTGFRVVPADKILTIEVLPSAEQAEPMKPFPLSVLVRDSSGAPAPGVELAISVVDRAVYAVQPEFRPNVVEFFYPLPRLNLSTFYSDDVQGYGYADEIRKPNFQLAALKSTTKPAKRSVRDTAGWFPHVVTDRSGRGDVTVDLPANLTEWLVTVVATDKDGRIGEGRGMFRASSDVAVDTKLPLFMREGDSVQGTVIATSLTESPVNLTVQSDAIAGVTLGATEATRGELAPKGELSLPLALVASEQGTGLIRTRIDGSGGRLGGPREFEIGVRSADFMVSQPVTFTGGAAVFSPPDGGRVRRVSVGVSRGLLGASLNAARKLVSYPYGCTEQLAHSSMPNLVLLSLVTGAGLSDADLQRYGLADASKRAKRYAEEGIRKILGNQKASGGFGLWPSDPSENFTVTLMAIRALDEASRLEVPFASQALYRARSWISQEVKRRSFPQGSILSGYEIGMLAQLGFSGELDARYRSFVEETDSLGERAEIGDVLAALAIVNARKDHYWFMNTISRPDVQGSLVRTLSRHVSKWNDASWLRSSFQDFDEVGFAPGASVLAASALAALSPNEVPREMQRALEARVVAGLRDGWWGSTFESGEVIYRLKPLLDRELAEEIKIGQTPRMTLGKDRPIPLQPLPGGWFGEVALDESSEIDGKVAATGLSERDIVTGSIESVVPLAHLKENASGIAVSRRLSRITGKGSSIILPGARLNVGDVIVSEVRVKREMVDFDGGMPSRMVLVADAIPSLAEGIDEDREYLEDAGVQGVDSPTWWAKIRETYRYPDRTERVVELAPGSEKTLYQVWRVAYRGTASLGAASAFDMYREELRGNSDAGTISVD